MQLQECEWTLDLWTHGSNGRSDRTASQIDAFSICPQTAVTGRRTLMARMLEMVALLPQGQLCGYGAAADELNGSWEGVCVLPTLPNRFCRAQRGGE